MSSLRARAWLPGLLALALTVVAAGPAGAHAHKAKQRLVVRGEATAVAGPCDAAGCRVDLAGGAFQGAPVVDVAGDSCQVGDAFAGLARFSIVRGSGRYAGATGSGLASLDEDAAHRHRIALVGRIRSGS